MGFLPTRPERRHFYSWVPYTSRSLSFATNLGAKNFFHVGGKSLGPFKYTVRTAQTLLELLRDRPAVVFAMSPPYFLGLTVYCYALFFRCRYVIDAHTGAFDDPKWTWMMPLNRFLMKRARFVVLTNDELAGRARAMGAQPVVLTDIPFTLQSATYPVEAEKFTIGFICTYASDEPILEVFDAVRNDENIHVYVTGNAKKANRETHDAKPNNVTLTGFLSEEKYAGLLQSVDCILVLTTRNFTMQRGGSEAITAGKPLITSDWPILKEQFSSGTIHVENSAAAIRIAIQETQANHETMRKGIESLRTIRQERWEAVLEILNDGLKN